MSRQALPLRSSYPKHKSKYGFTLIELSIVLVVIGLVIGGVLAGQELIRAAELRSIVSDIERFRVAVNTYYIKFNYRPGDNPNCINYFPTLSICGNGDEQITPSASEGLAFWQELGLAGLIKGNYTGWGSNYTIASGIPGSKLSNGGYVVLSGTYVNQPFNNLIYFAGMVPGVPYPYGGILTAAEASRLDQKIDDGVANSGAMMAGNGYDGATYPNYCTDGFNPGSAPGNYTNLTGNQKSCLLVFKVLR